MFLASYDFLSHFWCFDVWFTVLLQFKVWGFSKLKQTTSPNANPSRNKQMLKSPKHTMKVKEKSDQCWTLKNFPYRCMFTLFLPLSSYIFLDITCLELPWIGKLIGEKWQASGAPQILLFMPLHLMASVPAARGMKDRKELTQPFPAHLFDSTRVFNQNHRNLKAKLGHSKKPSIP